MKRPLISLLLLSLVVLSAGAQTTREELRAHLELASGNYCDYPLPTGELTPAPEGYEPFYISHYGRHGARYMTNDRAYRRLLHQLDTARTLELLTPLGENVYHRLEAAYADAWHRDGDLTALGGRQHRGIARRMVENYPSLLGQPLSVKANSSTVRRCMLSMAYFCLELQSLNPTLSVEMDASSHDMHYLTSNDSIAIPEAAGNGALYRKLDAFRHEMLNGRRQLALVFTDPVRAKEFVDPYTFADDLWNITSDMLCVPELKLSFNDLFTDDELIDGFRAYNASWCLWEGLMPGSQPSYYGIYPLLKNFLDEADAMIRSGESGLRLRFGHDSALLPLAFLFGVKEAVYATDDMEDLHHHFTLFRLIPMAGNIQLVFFRKPGSEDILVKFLMNENETSIPLSTDCYPYYHWTDVERFYRGQIEAAGITYKDR